MKALTTGMKVRVYRDRAFTQFEDTGKLVSRVATLTDGFEDWKVRYAGGNATTKTVHPKNIVTGNQRVLRVRI